MILFCLADWKRWWWCASTALSLTFAQFTVFLSYNILFCSVCFENTINTIMERFCMNSWNDIAVWVAKMCYGLLNILVGYNVQPMENMVIIPIITVFHTHYFVWHSNTFSGSVCILDWDSELLQILRNDYIIYYKNVVESLPL